MSNSEYLDGIDEFLLGAKGGRLPEGASEQDKYNHEDGLRLRATIKGSRDEMLEACKATVSEEDVKRGLNRLFRLAREEGLRGDSTESQGHKGTSKPSLEK